MKANFISIKLSKHMLSKISIVIRVWEIGLNSNFYSEFQAVIYFLEIFCKNARYASETFFEIATT